MNSKTAILLVAITGSAVALAESPVPERLSDTGLYAPGTTNVHPANLPYTPQYPLWSDGAGKRRWLYLPPGTSIDASRPDEWNFPRGTRLWKEFSHGRPIETRFIERLDDGTWRYATYLWNADGSDADLVTANGIPALAVAEAPGGRYAVPSQDDCRACHEGAQVPVLGVSALQLSPDRDPLAPHAEIVGPYDIDLQDLISRGSVSNLPATFLAEAPRIEASTPVARSALGYLHANCGHCHNDTDTLGELGLVLAHRNGHGPDRILGTLFGRSSELQIADADTRVVPGRPDVSLLVKRMGSRSPYLQMPPLGTRIVDNDGLALVEQWIQESSQETEED